MDNDAFEGFSNMLGIQDGDAMSSQPARDVPDVNQELPNRSLFGSGLGVAFECDTALSCVAETDVHCTPQLD